ncbi:MAG: M56 family metallopeptidase, partial [Actinomycetaceae bacterium]
MTASAALVAALLVGLCALALTGPLVLRRAAPALVRAPRLAVVVIVAGLLTWLGTALAVGPMLAWSSNGPALLPDGPAIVCRRCLEAANPFGDTSLDTGLPSVLLLALPAALTLALVVVVGRDLVRRRRRSRETARRLLSGAQRRLVAGHDLWVVDSDRPTALSFPRRHGGIVVSRGTLEALDDQELAAVLAHEDAHLRQYHHLIADVVASLAVALRYVPFVAAAAGALPHYLEIAADDEARRRAGTPALVSALVALGERGRSATPAGDGALHAAG